MLLAVLLSPKFFSVCQPLKFSIISFSLKGRPGQTELAQCLSYFLLASIVPKDDGPDPSSPNLTSTLCLTGTLISHLLWACWALLSVWLHLHVPVWILLERFYWWSLAALSHSHGQLKYEGI